MNLLSRLKDNPFVIIAALLITAYITGKIVHYCLNIWSGQWSGSE